METLRQVKEPVQGRRTEPHGGCLAPSLHLAVLCYWAWLCIAVPCYRQQRKHTLFSSCCRLAGPGQQHQPHLCSPPPVCSRLCIQVLSNPPSSVLPLLSALQGCNLGRLSSEAGYKARPKELRWEKQEMATVKIQEFAQTHVH